MYNNYLIRKAEPADIPEIVKLCGEHAEYEQAEFDPAGKAQKLALFLFSEDPRAHCLIAQLGKKVLGYATFCYEFSTWDAELYTNMDCLYLRPHARGFGIGQRLVETIKQISRKNNCYLMQWHTPSFNERAIKFYHRIGAQSKDKVRFYLNDKKK